MNEKMRRTEEEKRERERERERRRGERPRRVHVQQQSVGEKKNECEEEQKPDGPEQNRNRRNGRKSGEAFRVRYGMVMTVRYTHAECVPTAIGPTIPRRPFSVHMYSVCIASTRGHLDAFRVAKSISCGKDSHLWSTKCIHVHS